MSDEYTITTRSEGLLGKIGQWGAALIADEELLEALAAHDAEVRAGVVTEESEWEYGVRVTGDNEPFTDHYDSLDAMSEEFDGRVVWNVDEEIVRRRKAGPWVPAKQEAAEADA